MLRDRVEAGRTTEPNERLDRLCSKRPRYHRRFNKIEVRSRRANMLAAKQRSQRSYPIPRTSVR